MRTGDAPAAERCRQGLQCFAGQHHWVLVDRVLGMLEAFLGDMAGAERHFEDAVRIATNGGIRPELALTLAERGLANLRAAGDDASRATGERQVRDGIERLEALGMAGEVERFTAILRSTETLAADPRALPAGLTAREVEVLALVCQGLTNRGIGTRLGISEKTVTNHLTHIFTKANLDNRASAVAFALRHGLA